MTENRPSDSAVETTHLLLPPDTNHHGTAFGGKILQWMDIAAAIAATRHCRSPVVTVSVDDLSFERPIRLGDVVRIRTAVNYTGRTSMEVGCRVERENPQTQTHEHALTGYFTFVAVDTNGDPIPVPGVKPENSDEKRRFDAGALRRKERLERSEKKRSKS